MLAGRQQGPTGRAAGHHVAVVAENRQRVGCHGSGRDVKHRRGQLAGDLEHVGDHQQEALRCRESACHSPSLQRAVNGAGGTRLTLHLHHVGNRAENVLLSGRSPGIGQFAHVAGGSDRVNRHHLVAEVSDRRRRFIAIDGHEAFLCHGYVSLSEKSGSKQWYGRWSGSRDFQTVPCRAGKSTERQIRSLPRREPRSVLAAASSVYPASAESCRFNEDPNTGTIPVPHARRPWPERSARTPVSHRFGLGDTNPTTVTTTSTYWQLRMQYAISSR